MSLQVTTTGWYGIPGRTPTREPAVHAVFQKKPICGGRIHPEAEYQWCAHGLLQRMVTCKGCLKVIERHRDPQKEINDALKEIDRCRDSMETAHQQVSRTLRRLQSALEKAQSYVATIKA